MGGVSWPSEAELNEVREIVSEMAGRGAEEVRVVASPYRICPLGAHIDHQGGMVSAMKINKGILLGFVPSGDTRGLIGYICGSEGLDSSGLSSSAAVSRLYLGISDMLMVEKGWSCLPVGFGKCKNIIVSPEENIEYDRLIENKYLGLRNGILDQSAILLSSHGCLLCMNCKTKEHKLIKSENIELRKPYKLLLAFSGLKQALTRNPGYNCRVSECQEAAVEPEAYRTHKDKLEPDIGKRAEHYFSENLRVNKGLERWASGKLEDFGRLITTSGLSLFRTMSLAPGIFRARFSGAGFRGCCLTPVDANHADEAALLVRSEYPKLQPELAIRLNQDTAVLICEAGDCARVIS